MRTDNPIPRPAPKPSGWRAFFSLLRRLFRRGLWMYISASIEEWERELTPDQAKVIRGILELVQHEFHGDGEWKRLVAADQIRERYPELSERAINRSIELMLPGK